jgi:hypothetical protein
MAIAAKPLCKFASKMGKQVIFPAKKRQEFHQKINLKNVKIILYD